MQSCLLRFRGVDNGGVDPLSTLAVFAMVEMILLDNVILLCFCCVVCVFFVVVEERLAFGVRLLSGEILRGMSSTWWHSRKLVSKLNTREQKFNKRKKIFDLPKICHSYIRIYGVFETSCR